MRNHLRNYPSGQWQAESQAAHTPRDPVTGEAAAVTGGRAEGLEAGFSLARQHGAAALQAMRYAQRAALPGEVVKALQANREEYYRFALLNPGITRADAAVDIEGACFTLNYYANTGAALDGRTCKASSPQRQMGIRIEGMALPA